MKVHNDTSGPYVIALNRYNVINYPSGVVEIPSASASFHFNLFCNFSRSRRMKHAITVYISAEEDKMLGCPYSGAGSCLCREAGKVRVEKKETTKSVELEKGAENDAKENSAQETKMESVEGDEKGIEQKQEETKTGQKRGRKAQK